MSYCVKHNYKGARECVACRLEKADTQLNSMTQEMKESNKLLAELHKENREMRAKDVRVMLLAVELRERYKSREEFMARDLCSYLDLMLNHCDDVESVRARWEFDKEAKKMVVRFDEPPPVIWDEDGHILLVKARKP